jgi:hypothetical protein
MRAVALVTVLALAGTVRADEADDLVAQGDELARRAEYAQAIEKFKAADRARPRAMHACMIGLAYLRRQLWPQAEVFLSRCRKRAVASDPLPEWMEDAESQLAAQLKAAPVTAVEIVVQPPGVAASITTSSFAPDEIFDPQIIHLPAGPHTITVGAPGFVTVKREITVSGSGSERVEVVLSPVPPPIVEEPVKGHAMPVTVVRHDNGHRTWGNRLLIGAGGATVGAIVLHVLAYRTRDKLMGTPEEYRANETAFDIERAGAISLYAIAGIAAGIGIYLRQTHKELPPRVGAVVTGDGAMVTIGWSR